jgi:hypothetical protein
LRAATIPTDRIRLTGESPDAPEDILASCLGVIFPDDITHQGQRGHLPLPLELSVADPQAEDRRRLFSHFLWAAAATGTSAVSAC